MTGRPSAAEDGSPPPLSDGWLPAGGSGQAGTGPGQARPGFMLCGEGHGLSAGRTRQSPTDGVSACGAGMRLVAVGTAGRHQSVVLAIVQWGFSWVRQGGDESVSKFLGGHFPERRVCDQSSGERRDVVTRVVSRLKHLGESGPVALRGEAGVDLVGEGGPPAGGVTVLRLEAGSGPSPMSPSWLAAVLAGSRFQAVTAVRRCSVAALGRDTGAVGSLGRAARPG